MVNGLFAKVSQEKASGQVEKVMGLLGVNKFANFNSKLSMWVNGAGVEKVVHVFTNQSLNPLYNYGSRPIIDLDTLWYINLKASFDLNSNNISLTDDNLGLDIDVLNDFEEKSLKNTNIKLGQTEMQIQEFQEEIDKLLRYQLCLV